MCYRNGTGYRCECCGKEAKEIKFVTYGADELDNKPVFERDRLCPETEEVFCSGRKIPKPALMIAVTPGEPMKIITEFEVEECLPDFEFKEDIAELPELGLIMSYQEEGVFQVGDRYYLETPFLIYNLEDDGEYVSLTGEEIYAVQEFLKKRTVLVRQDGDEMPVIDMN